MPQEVSKRGPAFGISAQELSESHRWAARHTSELKLRKKACRSKGLSSAVEVERVIVGEVVLKRCCPDGNPLAVLIALKIELDPTFEVR